MLFTQERISECCLQYTFGDKIHPDINSKVLRVYHHLKNTFDRKQFPLFDILPTYNSIAIHFPISSSLFYDSAPLTEAIQMGLQKPFNNLVKHHIIPASYTGQDIEFISTELKLSPREVIDLHANKKYTLAMLGFRPYFPYLLGLDPKLNIPRRSSPRKEVAQGSIAIAAGQTGIYSTPSPGGWHIIAKTSFADYSKLQPGDTIEFKEV